MDFLQHQCGTQTLPMHLQLPLHFGACQGRLNVAEYLIQQRLAPAVHGAFFRRNVLRCTR
ncbi:hypothetical protein D3C77_740140 [compost metagenome]